MKKIYTRPNEEIQLIQLTNREEKIMQVPGRDSCLQVQIYYPIVDGAYDVGKGMPEGGVGGGVALPLSISSTCSIHTFFFCVSSYCEAYSGY